MSDEAKTYEEKILLPGQIIDGWTERLCEVGFNERQRTELNSVIQLTLPYPSQRSLELCVSGYAASCYDKPAVGPDAGIVSSALERLKYAELLETSNRYAQSHPVATGIKRISAAASALKIPPNAWLSVFIGQCQQALTHAESVTRGTYYRHIVSLRDVLMFIMRSQVIGNLPANEPVALACSRLNALFTNCAQMGEPMPMPISSVNNLDVKIDVVCALLDGALSFGVPSVIRSPKETTDSTKSRISGRNPAKLPQYLTPQPQDLKHPRPRPMVPRRQSLAYALGEGAEDIPQQRIRNITVPVQGDPEARVDSEEMEHAWVDAPPEFAPSERRKQYVSLLNVQAAQTTLSRSDMQRFSRRQLSTWLERFADEHPLTAVFLLLVWSLGMAPERKRSFHDVVDLLHVTQRP